MTAFDRTENEELIKLCLNGDEEAWQKLVEKVTPAIISVCQTMRLSPEESLDIFGQVCFLFLKHITKLKSPDKLVGYVSMITRREVLRGIRRKNLFDKIDPDITKSISTSDFKNPDLLLEETRKHETLFKAIEKLPEKEYKLIWHLFLDESEPSYEEISKKLDIPISSIGPTRQRSLNKLRNILKKK